MALILFFNMIKIIFIAADTIYTVEYACSIPGFYQCKILQRCSNKINHIKNMGKDIEK